jgi:hypothetical protein
LAEETYRLVAFVATFIAQSFFVRILKPPTPWQEFAGEMDVLCLLNVRNHEIVELWIEN